MPVEDEQEEILRPTPGRFVMFPVKYPRLWEMFQCAQNSFWRTSEIDLSTDPTDWQYKLNADARHFIKHVLAFFAAADGIVNENLAQRFMTEVQIPEARAFYSFQLAMESVHAETYSLLLTTLIRDSVERNHLFNAIETIPAVKKKAEWAMKWMAADRPFGERLVAFAVVEGIFFSASFCALFWLKKQGVMPGLTFSNEMISRDEAMHCEFACELFALLKNRPSAETVTQIVEEAVQVEACFVSDALNVKLIGMNANLMNTYVQFVADWLLYQLGVPKRYNVANPFDWMGMLAMDGKTNFFEKRVGEYAKANLHTSTSSDASSFSMTEDF